MSIKQIVKEYLKLFPAERGQLNLLEKLVEQASSDESLLSRTNFVGHVTASAFIVSRGSKKVLRVQHKTHRLFLQPGGHFDQKDASLVETAKREAREETGITQLEYLPYSYDELIPIDIDTHAIAENPRKQEVRHYHHDFRYLFLYDGDESELSPNLDEIDEIRWDDLNALHAFHTFDKIIPKLQHVLSGEFNTHRFFHRLTHDLRLTRRAGAVVVAHLLHGTEEYINAIHHISDRVVILPKQKSLVEEVYSSMRGRYSILREVHREELIQANVRTHVFDQMVGPTVLFDIGGWFSQILPELADEFPGKILGIVEDTENGLQKYEALNREGKLHIPVVSVARSPLKENEDFLIGQSVLFSADALLRNYGVLFQYLNCSVLGYGKIGKSIAHHLLLRGSKPNVFDIDPIRSLEAHNRLCNIYTKSEIARKSDVIFCATGNQVLDVIDFRELKDGCFVFSVTSSDDELNLQFLAEEYRTEEVSEHITKFSSPNNYFHLVNNGNAVNFIHKAVVSHFINLVRGEMLACYDAIVSQDLSPGIHGVAHATRDGIARLWFEVFLEYCFPKSR